MKRRPAVSVFPPVAIFLALALAGCQPPLQPNTHSGDPLEPPWVMNPDVAKGSYPGPYIFGVGASQKGLPDRLVARRQAEANARSDIGRRLSDLTSSKVIQWTRNQGVDEKWLSSSEIRTMSSNLSVEYLQNVEVVEYWASGRTGEYFALARMKYGPAFLRIRDEINESLARKLQDRSAAEVLSGSLERELGIIQGQAE